MRGQCLQMILVQHAITILELIGHLAEAMDNQQHYWKVYRKAVKIPVKASIVT